MTTDRRILILISLAIAGLIGALATVMVPQLREPIAVSPPTRPKLPDDVERVIEGYTYQETDNGLTIDISGNRVIHRGREMLGFRSNLIKATYFETIRGTLRSNKGNVEFSASDAEWDTKPSSPLILRRDVVVSVNNRHMSHVKTARIYFRQGVLEVTGDRKEEFHLR
jgi:hypothetical protein